MIPIYFLEYEGTPERGRDSGGKIGGGFINCWINSSNLNDAASRASKAIRDHGWIVGNYDAAREVSIDHYSHADSGYKYFQQAMIDGEVFVFHIYPVVDDPDG